MFKPLLRSHPKPPRRSNGGFADTQFVHHSEDEDYSGFAPTQMADDIVELVAAPESDAPDAPDQVVLPATLVGPTPAAHAAASSSRTALQRAAGPQAPTPVPEPAPGDGPYMPQSWATSQWVTAQEAKAHEAAHQARVVIAAQRRAEAQADVEEAVQVEPAALTGIARLRAAFERLLPGEFRSLLPLFIGVSVTMAMISAVLPLFDKL